MSEIESGPSVEETREGRKDRLRRIEHREWWLWGTAAIVTSITPARSLPEGEFSFWTVLDPVQHLSPGESEP
jgi:hypothetical protein